MARFVTTYHRAGRYLVDATPMLAFLKDGGMRKIRYDASSQKYLSKIDFRFSNRGIRRYKPLVGRHADQIKSIYKGPSLDFLQVTTLWQAQIKCTKFLYKTWIFFTKIL